MGSTELSREENVYMAKIAEQADYEEKVEFPEKVAKTMEHTVEERDLLKDKSPLAKVSQDSSKITAEQIHGLMSQKHRLYDDDELEQFLVDWIDNPDSLGPIKKVKVTYLYDIDGLRRKGDKELYFLTELEEYRKDKMKRTYNGLTWHYSYCTEAHLTEKVHYQVMRRKKIVDDISVIVFTQKEGPKDKVLVKVMLDAREVMEVVPGKDDNRIFQVQETHPKATKNLQDQCSSGRIMIQKYDALLLEKEKEKEQYIQKYDALLLEKEKEQKEKEQYIKQYHEAQMTVASLGNQYANLELKFKHKEEKLLKILKDNRDLHNMVIELRGNVRVICRCRPLNEQEIKRGLSVGIKFDAENGEITVGSANKTFKFDALCTPEEDQETMFEKISPFVTSVLDGYTVCIFAYGQTGSGKTFTIEGVEGAPGMTFRTLEKLFDMIKERKMPFDEYEVVVSVKEVYNEDILVLLDDQIVTKMEDAWSCIRKGSQARVIHSTNANEHSSRSHCVQCITVKAKELISGDCKEGKLWIVDLAGSERSKHTGAEGERLMEANFTNKSLSTLSLVISALASKARHIPYRNSKLTMLLQDGLRVGSKVLMLAHISPSPDDISETISTLKFATGVRKVELGEAKQSSRPGKPTDKPTPAVAPLGEIPEESLLPFSLTKTGNKGSKIRQMMTSRKAGGAAALHASKSELTASHASKNVLRVTMHNHGLLSPLIGRSNRLLLMPQAGGKKAAAESSCLQAARGTPIVVCQSIA